jgi:hypothetical protein
MMNGLLYQRYDIDVDSYISVYDAKKADFPINDDDAFIDECDAHGNYVTTFTRADADDRAVAPIEWCGECFEKTLGA